MDRRRCQWGRSVWGMVLKMWRAERETESDRERDSTRTDRQRDQEGQAGGRKEWEVCGLWPLLAPSGPRRTVHSSIWPKVSKSRRTSSSLCCLPSIPTNSFLSSRWEERKGERREGGRKEGVWKREQTNATADGTVLLSWTFISSLLCWALAAAAAVIVVDLYCCVVCHPALVWGRCIPVSSELFKSATGTFDRDDVRSAVGFRER